ncbi:MAG: DUF3291 domain-containing protein [Armatimonadota bacterium]|nr:DUF3291 domain-containing protein [Armatimonadota bacterium]
MALISITRLRVRSLRYLLPFVGQALAAARQAEHSSGFLGGRLLREAKNTFWTLTAWEDVIAMRAYMLAGAHRQAMPKLLEWCDEASVAHWDQAEAELPDWIEAHRRMVEEGRPSKVHHPSPAHAALQIPAPQISSRFDRVLRPVSPLKS